MTTYARTTDFVTKTTLLQQDVVTEVAAVEASYNAINKDQTSKVDTLPRQLFANPGGINVLSFCFHQAFVTRSFDSVWNDAGDRKSVRARADAFGDPYGGGGDPKAGLVVLPTGGNYFELATLPVRATCRPIFGVLSAAAGRAATNIESDYFLFRLLVNARQPAADPLADNPIASYGRTEGVIAAELSGFDTALYPHNVKEYRVRQQFALAVASLNRGDTLTLAMSFTDLPDPVQTYGLSLDLRCDIWCSALQIGENLE